MVTEKSSTIGTKLNVTILAMLVWMAWMLGWLAFAWSHHSFLQNLAGLGISTLLFAATVAVLWVGTLSCVPIATILVTLGWFGFTLYWIGFMWGRYALLQNVVVLMASFLLFQGLVVISWLFAPPTEQA